MFIVVCVERSGLLRRLLLVEAVEPISASTYRPERDAAGNRVIRRWALEIAKGDRFKVHVPITIRHKVGASVETRLLVDRGALADAWRPAELWDGGEVPDDAAIRLRRRG